MSEKIIFLGTQNDRPYLPRLKGLVGTASVIPVLEPITTIADIALPAKKRGITKILSTSPILLERLVDKQTLGTVKKKPSISNYAGSYFLYDGIEYVFIDPLEQLITVNYSSFLAKRYISKLADPSRWLEFPEFNWCLIDSENAQEAFDYLSECFVISCDIETFSNPVSIRCIGYTGVRIVGDKLETKSFVLPINSTFNLTWMRKINGIPVPKIFQNGKYDISYLSRYNAVPSHYFWDTANMFHSWYSELPKDLGFLQAFFVRTAAYWKDLAETSDLQQYYLYNAKDTWATACVWIACMLEMPKWGKDNYLTEFPLVFPCHLAEMTGIKRDMSELEVVEKEQQDSLLREQQSLNRMLGIPVGSTFNTNSPVQMKALLKVLGCGDLQSADEKNLKKASLRHPLNGRIIGKIIAIRKLRKLISTYVTAGKEFDDGFTRTKQYRTILYALNPHATDTTRLASKEHHFWCGLQIQNIPRGVTVKRTLVAADGFRIAECDLEQAESRDTAHIAGDENLIVAVSGDRDFHSVNASAFFGVPYSSIYSDELRKTIDKALRDLAKRVNHGANYNMGPNVLVETMGEDKVAEAARLLKLPKLWSYKQIAEYLLAQFHKTYPAISRVYYPGVIHEIMTTRMLTSKAKHHCEYQATEGSLVRYCFGNPEKNKSDLNAYVAHPPQSLNAQTLNRAFMRVFYDIAIHPDHSKNFRLNAQIHDSILFQFREGHEYLATMVKERMEIPVTVTGYDGKTRTFTVPAAIKAGKDGKGSLRWSETE